MQCKLLDIGQSKPIMTTQAELAAQLKQAQTEAEKRSLASDLLANSRQRQYIDLALRALAQVQLDDSYRPVLREKALFYFMADPAKDKGGLIREAIARLLVNIGHPDDIDIYLKGVMTYHYQPVNDSAQNLRAVSLVGLAQCDTALGLLHATRLLGEEDTAQLNCEPSMTAALVLGQHGQMLPLYQFLLWRGIDFAKSARVEVVARVFELLNADFPDDLLERLILPYVEMDIPAVTSGIVNAIVDKRREALYLFLVNIIQTTGRSELRHYALIMLAAAHDAILTEQLYELASCAPHHHIPSYIEAVEVSNGSAKETILATLRKRLR